MVNLEQGTIVAGVMAALGGLGWLLRLHGRVQAHDLRLEENEKAHDAFTQQNAEDHREIKQDVRYIRARLDDIWTNSNGHR